MSGPINPPTYAKGSRFIGRKSSTDDYETPAWATEALYNYLTGTLALDLGTNIVDPCCGRGIQRVCQR